MLRIKELNFRLPKRRVPDGWGAGRKVKKAPAALALRMPALDAL